MAQVDQVAYRLASYSHVIEELGFVVGCEFRDRLEFNDNAFANDNVRPVVSIQAAIFVERGQFWL
jgi:hypothetical protein